MYQFSEQIILLVFTMAVALPKSFKGDIHFDDDKHSAQWSWNIQGTWEFWERLYDELM